MQDERLIFFFHWGPLELSDTVAWEPSYTILVRLAHSGRYTLMLFLYIFKYRTLSSFAFPARDSLSLRVELSLKTDSKLIAGIPRTRGLLNSSCQTLGIPSTITTLGQLYQSPP